MSTRRSLCRSVCIAGALTAIAGCGGDAASPKPTYTLEYATQQILLPTNVDKVAYDENGDGRAENALGNLFTALATQGIDLQAMEDASVATGKTIELFKVQTHDSTLTSDNQATVTLYAASPGVPAPGPYTVDQGVAPAVFTGTVGANGFSSASPATAANAVQLTLRLAIGDTSVTVPLPLWGAHVTLVKSQASGVSAAINGVVKVNDVSNILVPSLAAAFTAAIQRDTTTTLAHQLESLLDLGGCQGAVAKDYQIAACEVSSNALMQSFLVPDVQMFDGNGNYAPSATGSAPNALSFGVRFSLARSASTF